MFGSIVFNGKRASRFYKSYDTGEQIPCRSKEAVIDVTNEYDAVFDRLEKNIAGMEYPVQLWLDRTIYRRISLGSVYKNEYEKIYIPKGSKELFLLAKKKLQEMKEERLSIR